MHAVLLKQSIDTAFGHEMWRVRVVKLGREVCHLAVWLIEFPVFVLTVLCPMSKYCRPGPRQSGRIQEGRGYLMGSDDICLEYLAVIIMGITLHRLTQSLNLWLFSAVSVPTYFKDLLHWKLLLIWSLPLVVISERKALQRNCSDRSCRFSVCAVVMLVFRYAGVPDSSTYYDSKQPNSVLCHDWHFHIQLIPFLHKLKVSWVWLCVLRKHFERPCECKVDFQMSWVVRTLFQNPFSKRAQVLSN